MSDQLSVLFLTYNRSDLLLVAFASLRAILSKTPELGAELVVSDDASDPSHLQVITDLGADRVVRTEENRGLSHNHNKGLSACTHEYVLSLQDDWEFVGEPAALLAALHILRCDQEVGVVNFLPPTHPLAGVTRTLPGGIHYAIFDNDGVPRRRPAGYRPYTDRPHVKRKTFIHDIGPYREDLPMTLAEVDFQTRVACQTRWKIAHLQGESPFRHLGAERSFNPGFHRAQRLERQYRIPLVGPAYRVARSLARSIRSLMTRGLPR